MLTKVVITQEMIDEANRLRKSRPKGYEYCRHCIMGLAMTQARGKETRSGYSDWYDKNTNITGRYGKEVTEYILDWDTGRREIKPTEFMIEI